MQVADRNTIATMPRVSDGFVNAGHSARPSSSSQKSRPTNSRICHTRPMLVNSSPCAPSQKVKSKPWRCSVPSQPKAVEPTTIATSA
jgi:hypothetical protein